MDIAKAIATRKSIRAFQTKSVPKEILAEIIRLSLRAPSWSNTQPWEIAVAGGKPLEEINQAFLRTAEEIGGMQPDLAAPQVFPDRHDARRRVLGRKVFELMGIGREDREKRVEWSMRGLSAFGAPNVIYIYTDRALCYQEGGLTVWPAFDCGLVAQNIMLLAPEYDLGTVPAIQAVAYPDVLRKVLGIPDSKVFVLGIAIGYPDWDHPINALESERDPLEDLAVWFGFDEDV